MRHLPALLLCVALGSVAQAAGRTTSVTGEGHAVLAGDRAQAYAQAKQQALHDAVAQVVRGLGGPAEGDDETLDRTLYARAASFALRATVLDDDVDGTILNLRAQVIVDADAVARALGGRRAAGKAARGGGHEGKRILVLATEQLGPHRLFGWADLVWQPGLLTTRTQVVREVREMGGIEAALSERMAGAGFSVIDPHVLRGRLAPRPAFEALDLSNGLAQQVAQKSDADYVVIAKGVAQLAHHATIAEGGMRSGQGNVVARLVRVRDGRVLASTTQHAAAVHLDAETARIQALDEAARLAGEALTSKLGTHE